MLILSPPLQSQSFTLWCQISRHSNSLLPFLEQKKKQSKTNNTPLFLRNHAHTKSTKNDIDFDFPNDFSSSPHNPRRDDKDYDKDPEFADILGSCLDDPLKARSKVCSSFLSPPFQFFQCLCNKYCCLALSQLIKGSEQ